MSTPETPAVVTPISTETNTEKSNTPETIASPVSPETPATVSHANILEGVHNLCNTTLYVLTHSYYRGEDAHLVLQAKEFLKEIRKDVENKQKLVAAGKSVNVD